MQKLQSQIKNHPIPFLETLTGLTLNPAQRSVILSKSPRLIYLGIRQSGKSTVLGGLAFLAMMEGKSVCTLQPAVRQAVGLVDMVRGWIFKMGIVPIVCSRTEIILANGGSIVARPIKSSSRGMTVDLLLLDELSYIEENTDDDILSIATPFLSKPGSRLVISSSARRRSGLFYTLWTEENNGFEKVEGNIDEVLHYGEDYLKSMRLLLGETGYAREFLNRFSDLSEIVLFSELDFMKFRGEKICTTTNTDLSASSLPGISESILPREKGKISAHWF